MALALLIGFVFATLAAVVLLHRRFLRAPSTVAASSVVDAQCGRCGYCVRGVPGLICPECGSDLREVGIVTPGAAPSLGPWGRLVVWTLIIPLPALALGGMVGSLVGPRTMVTTQNRVIFSHASYFNEIINVEREGTKLVWGPANSMQPVPLQRAVIRTNASTTPAPMTVDLVTGTFRYTDGAGGQVTGPFDAAAIEKWLNRHGYTDPRVASSAQDLAAAIAEMDTPAGNGFRHLSPDPQRGGLAMITAHPASTFTRLGTAWAAAVMVAVMILLWLAGLPFVLRGRPAGAATGSASPPAVAAT